jgi:hypothetical protein
MAKTQKPQMSAEMSKPSGFTARASGTGPTDADRIPAHTEYDALSLRDRDQYHVHLMRHPRVVATAVGYYRIRRGDSWPGVKPAITGVDRRTLENSEVRAYSWPAVLVFVDQWLDVQEFGQDRGYDPDQIVPKTLFLPDGRRVPVCVIEAPRDPVSPAQPPAIRFPLNNIGSGHPVLIDVQQRDHVATIACLVTDGHKAYALTNRHVTGDPGEQLSSKLGGRLRPIGRSATGEVTRVPFSDVYPGWPARSVYINMDVGLIDIDNINDWTAKLQDGSVMGPMVDLSVVNFPLSLIGRRVQGYGAASQLMQGEIQALFYRYKSRGGFEYVADFFIGPRTPTAQDPKPPAFSTMPGDSGTLWLLEPISDATSVDTAQVTDKLRPLAIQWGANRLYSGMSKQPHAYALTTCLSTVCDRLDVDVVRDWNLDQPDTWGAVGHFAIASRVTRSLSDAVPTLAELMGNNAPIISHDDQTILNDEFKHMGDAAFIPMADVPDFFWKHGLQHHSRGSEGPNHFADMDQKRPKDGVDLLTLCEDPANIDPAVWDDFYESVEDLLDGGPIALEHRGLLPFRVWQIFDQMVEFVRNDKMPEFVCAAGVLTHYVGDSCQPLHISYLHDGDPERAKSHVVNHVRGKKAGTTETVHIPLGKGLHSAYEDAMVNAHRKEILDGLDQTPKVRSSERVANGQQAARAVVELMRNTFKNLPPEKLLQAFLAVPKGDDVTEAFWSEFGDGTIAAMQGGTHVLAVLWESAWIAGGGEDKRRDTSPLTEDQAMGICAPADFLPSCTIKQIGPFLTRP